MTCNTPSNTVTIAGELISASNLRPGDKYRIIGPVHTAARPSTTPVAYCEYVLVERAPQYPSFWPPQEGDVWVCCDTGCEFFVKESNGRNIMNREALTKAVERGNKYELVHRRGRQLGNRCA